MRHDDDNNSQLFPVASIIITVPRPIEQSNMSKYFSISGPHLDIPLQLLRHGCHSSAVNLTVLFGDENASADGAMCEQQMMSEAIDAAVASEDVVSMVFWREREREH
eukprot:scaffold11445_cov113-Skeletonema_dohrnii-CCMP3373.AAC.5